MSLYHRLISKIQRKENVGKIFIVLACVTVFFISEQSNATYNFRQSIVEEIFGGSEAIMAADDFRQTFVAGKFGGPEVIIPHSERKPVAEIRYAAFGSSHTYGSTLQNRYKEAYVWRLSHFDQERGQNFAIRASGPEYPSSCLSTMIGDEEFDVIILEFFMMQNGLDVLVTRLRERFPDAIIVILRIWSPDRIWRNHNRREKASSWAHDHGFDKSYVHNKEFKKAFIETAGDGWDFFPCEGKVQYQEDIAAKLGAYLLVQPFNNVAGGAGGWLDIADYFLANDSHHLSADGGHEWVYNQVKAIVDRVGVPNDRNLGKFLKSDHCMSWFLSGIISEGLKYSSNGSIVPMPNTNKYGLEFTFSEEDIYSSWLEVENRKERVMRLSIGYMSTEPLPSKYPKMDVEVSNGEKFFIDTNVKPLYDGRSAHVSRTLELGLIKPHETLRIFFSPKEKTEWPFRVIQVMIK